MAAWVMGALRMAANRSGAGCLTQGLATVLSPVVALDVRGLGEIQGTEHRGRGMTPWARDLGGSGGQRRAWSPDRAAGRELTNGLQRPPRRRRLLAMVIWSENIEAGARAVTATRLAHDGRGEEQLAVDVDMWSHPIVLERVCGASTRPTSTSSVTTTGSARWMVTATGCAAILRAVPSGKSSGAVRRYSADDTTYRDAIASRIYWSSRPRELAAGVPVCLQVAGLGAYGLYI